MEWVQQRFGDQGGASLRCGREEEACFQAKTRLELGGKQGREREAVPPRLPSGWAAGLDLDGLRGVFREPEGTTASVLERRRDDFVRFLHPDPGS